MQNPSEQPGSGPREEKRCLKELLVKGGEKGDVRALPGTADLLVDLHTGRFRRKRPSISHVPAGWVGGLRTPQ